MGRDTILKRKLLPIQNSFLVIGLGFVFRESLDFELYYHLLLAH